MCVSPVASGRTGLFCNSKTNSNVQFRGSLIKLERDVLVNVSSGLKPKMKNIGNEIMYSATQCLRKIFNTKELPISKKAHITPILQNMDQFKASARIGNYTAKRNLEILERNNLKIPYGQVVADDGYIKYYHKDSIFRQIDEDVARGYMPNWKAEEIKRDLKFGSRNADLEGIVDADAASHVDVDDVTPSFTSGGVLDETTSDIVDSATDGHVTESVLETACDFFDKILDFFC